MKKYSRLILLVKLSLTISVYGKQTSLQIPQVTKSDYISAKCYNSFVTKMNGKCRYINVKAQPDNKTSNRTLDIYYSIIPATDRSKPKKEPIFILAGGPGPSITHDIHRLFYNSTAPHFKLLKHHDYIFVDYRGTGFSKPFPKCDRGKSEFINGLNKCVSKLPKGVDTTDYTTTYIAYDISRIIKKEHIKKANLFGISYGTRVASSIIRDYPQLVNKAVLEGVYSIEANGATQGNEAIFDKLSYLRDKYHKAYPKEDFETRLLEYINKLDKKNRLKRLEGIAWLAFENKSEEAIKKEFDKAKPSKNFGSYHEFPKNIKTNSYVDKKYAHLANSEIMATAIMICEEYVFRDLQPSYTFGFSKDLIKLTKGYSAGSPIPLDKLGESKIKTHKPDYRDMKPLVSDVPILLLSGEWDMQTPLFWAINAQKHLSNSKHFFFMGRNHAFATSDKKAIDIVDAFFKTKSLNSLNLYEGEDIKIIE